MERLLTVEEVCELIACRKSYLYALTSQKRIPFYRIGGFIRFRLSELEAWLSQKQQSPMIAESEARYGGH